MRRHLTPVLNYFGYFQYAPSVSEIHAFFPRKIQKKALLSLLEISEHEGKIVRLPNNTQFRLSIYPTNDQLPTTNRSLYTLPQYSIAIEKKQRANSPSIQKNRFKTVQFYIRGLEWYPLVRFVGLTGASAMVGLRENDDIDLCIVCRSGLVWSTRFFAVVLAKLLRLHGEKGICLNLFFDEDDLRISPKKQNSYIAHELLQMKPLIDKQNITQYFRNMNPWIYKFFPNAKIGSPKTEISPSKIGTIMNMCEQFLKSVQLPVIYRNRTGFYISKTQLWLFKSDFEKKLKRRGLVI